MKKILPILLVLVMVMSLFAPIAAADNSGAPSREDMRGHGLGRVAVEACVAECAELGIRRVFALTYQEKFFNHIGFATVEKDVLPQKIWADCVHCPKYPDCDEFAVLRVLG
ncbi:MAG: hypothetical protein IIY31_02090 [Desulfovibrio sp.]|nr:hypothetical protein [Desulfovibrio sp.]